MAYLIDTNVLVYRFDPRFPDKQRRAGVLMRGGIESGEARLCHQNLVEFVAATTRPLGRAAESSLLTRVEAVQEVEDLVRQFEVLYPTAAQLRLAIRGWSTYGFGWFDAHMWSYAEHFGLELLYSEDFQSGRTYGSVQVIDPFAEAAGGG